jgi:hypothetical protein
MRASTGDRYTCSDSSCGCEVEVKNPSRHQTEAGTSAARSASADTAYVDSTDVDTLRSEETESTSSQGDYGSQGAGSEGVFGTSGAGSSFTTQGRYGSDVTRHPGAPSSASRSSVSQPVSKPSSQGSQSNFSCCCGKPMHRAGQFETPSTRTASA